MRKYWIAPVAASALLVVAACSSGTSDAPTDTPATGTPPAATDAPATESAAPAAATISPADAEAIATDSLLTIDDFGLGWTQAPPDPDLPDLDLSEACAVIEEDELPGQIAGAISDNFTGPNEQEVSTGTAIFPDAASGEQAYEANLALMSACTDEFTTAYGNALENEFLAQGASLSDIEGLQVTLTPIDAPTLADDSAALRLLVLYTYKGRPNRFVVDVFYVRSGGSVGYASYYTKGDPDSAEEHALSAAFATKLIANAN